MEKKYQISHRSLKSSPSRISLADQIVTPEKLAEIPRRGRNSGVALSVKEVRMVAKGLQRQPVPGQKINDDDDDLAVLEEKIVKKIPKAKAIVKLPEKYEMLIEFFNSMVSSIRLLRLRGSLTSLSNICSRIESLTNRRFTSRHLAQLKYILPEAVLIKKVMVHDEIICCMKPDFQIALQLDAVQDFSKHKGDTAYSALMKIFRKRMRKFYKEHPEGDDIPEEELPELFSKNKTIELPAVQCRSSSSTNSRPSDNIPSLMHSHLPRSFQRKFSKKSSKCVTENSPSTEDPIFRVHSSPSMFSSESSGDQVTQTEQQPGCDSGFPDQSNILVGTPAKAVLTPAKLMTSTPDIGTSKISRPTMGYDTPPADKSVKRTARVLSFHTPNKKIIVEDEKREDESSSLRDDELNFLPESLLRSIKEKEMKTSEERKDGAAEAKRREKMIACLPAMFNLIHLIYQRGCRSVMTKQELLHKILSGNCKITDRTEIEEQLLLLQEIASDWISVKNASSGDTLYRINKLCSPDEIRQKLAEAK